MKLLRKVIFASTTAVFISASLAVEVSDKDMSQNDGYNIYNEVMKRYNNLDSYRVQLELGGCKVNEDVLNKPGSHKGYTWTSFSYEVGMQVKATQANGSPTTIALFQNEKFAAPESMENLTMHDISLTGTLVVRQDEVWFAVVRTESQADGLIKDQTMYICPHSSLTLGKVK